MRETTCKNFRRYNAKRPPKCNCTSCWMSYWHAHPGRFAALQQAVEAGRRKEVVGMVGEKYVKKFELFRSLIANATK